MKITLWQDVRDDRRAQSHPNHDRCAAAISCEPWFSWRPCEQHPRRGDTLCGIHAAMRDGHFTPRKHLPKTVARQAQRDPLDKYPRVGLDGRILSPNAWPDSRKPRRLPDTPAWFYWRERFREVRP